MFEIGLSTTSYKAAFAGKAASYLHSLTRQGTVLSGYHSLGSSELADELASVSGQVPNADTRAGCTKFAEFKTGVVANAKGFVPGKRMRVSGDGADDRRPGHVVRTHVGRLRRRPGHKETCIHPNSNAVDDVALPFSDPGYADRHNPFIYFHSLLDLGDCSTDDVDLTKLPAALRSAAKTPTFTYVAPDACADARAVAAAGSSTSGTTTTPGTTPTTGTTSTTTRRRRRRARDVDHRAWGVDGTPGATTTTTRRRPVRPARRPRQLRVERRAPARARRRRRSSAAHSGCQPPLHARRGRSGSPPRTRFCGPGCHGSCTRVPIARTACW